MQLLAKQKSDVMAWLACMPKNHGNRHKDLMMGLGGLPKDKLEGRSLRMEASEPLKGRSNSNDKVSMSYRCSGQDSDYLAHKPILAQSMQCKRRAFSLRSSLLELRCFSKHNDSA